MQAITREALSNDRSVQAEIDRINWYHDFDFPGGLRARTETSDKAFHRKLWAFIERNLDQINLRDKSVLDIGCWDGYWSFYAERRGARSVLAADDVSQNWEDGTGLGLARSLFQSQVEVNQEVSVYEIASLGRKFDVILCLGVYYHLYDPFYAFSQIRHCCHRDTVVGTDYLRPPAKHPFLQQFKHLLRVLQRKPSKELTRILLTCKPFAGENEQHCYAPPFGLRAYDPRFNGRHAG